MKCVARDPQPLHRKKSLTIFGPRNRLAPLSNLRKSSAIVSTPDTYLTLQLYPELPDNEGASK